MSNKDQYRLYIDHAMRKERGALGFLPWEAIDTIVSHGRIYTHEENEEPHSFLVRGAWRPTTKIHLAYTPEDDRRAHVAAELFARLIAEAQTLNVERISLRCADDLEANAFWQAMQCLKVQQIRDSNQRGRPINVYTLTLPKGEWMAEQIRRRYPKPGTRNLLGFLGLKERWEKHQANQIRKAKEWRETNS